MDSDQVWGEGPLPLCEKLEDLQPIDCCKYADSILNDGSCSSEIVEEEADSYINCGDDMSLDLLTLPPEIFLHICSFLNAKFILTTLTLVCHKLHEILIDDATWKIRMAKRWMQKYPPVPVGGINFNWKLACMEREEQCRLWSNVEKNMKLKSLKESIFAHVDAVHIAKGGEIAAAGSRDGMLHLWDLNKVKQGMDESETSLMQKSVGRAWLWTITSRQNIIVTGAWDTHIKFWDLNAGCSQVRDVKCHSAVLCTKFIGDILYAGSYSKNVYMIDPREPEPSMKCYHRRPVLCLAADEQYVISGSEDQTIKVFDRTAGKLYKVLQFEYFPMCLSYGMNQLWVGDKTGNIHLFNTHDNSFEPVMNCEVGHSGKITGVVHNLGSIITSSTDNTIKVLHPSIRPSSICTLYEHTAPVSGMDFRNEVLISGGASVVIWWPEIENRWKD